MFNHRVGIIAAALVLPVLLAGCFGAPAPLGSGAPGGAAGTFVVLDDALLTATAVVTGLTQPTSIRFAPSGAGVVVEQGGTVQHWSPGQPARPWLDLSHLLSPTTWEEGLLDVAFHPQFSSNGLLYALYTPTRRDDLPGPVQDIEPATWPEATAIGRVHTREADGTGRAPVDMVWHAARAHPIHAGGTLTFAPSGHLVVGVGEGDAPHAAQDAATAAGSLTRFVVAANGNLTPVPASADDRAPGIWVTGVRNPWKFSFDAVTGNLWIADIGHGRQEEITVVSATDLASDEAVNLGWPGYEGHWRDRREARNLAGPVTAATWTHPNTRDVPTGVPDAAGFCAILGGEVLHGNQWGDLDGHYVYGDFCNGGLWAIPADAPPTVARQVGQADGSPTTLTSGPDGTLWMTTRGPGTVWRLDPSSDPSQP